VVVLTEPDGKTLHAAVQQTLYLVDPRGGSLTIEADGGSGGSGGIGRPNGHDGSNGSDGRNGFDGSPGRGGSITVTYDPQAKPFLGTIHLSNRNGPPPLFREVPVAAPW